ncbi:MAG: inositol monophosphatase, partial [Alphaproteobacteria bacterium]|nr:inositol monophosphatase [Alphaproteobacteria bacterium]
LAWTAAGRVDGYWERDVNIWDCAAGIVLVREAGGIVSDFAGRTDNLTGTEIVCANENIHPQMLKLLKGVQAG